MTELVVEKDMVASVHYTGTFPEDGEEFDSSKGSEPLSFLVGHKQMIPGFEREMMGATVGEKRTFTLPLKMHMVNHLMKTSLNWQKSNLVK